MSNDLRDATHAFLENPLTTESATRFATAAAGSPDGACAALAAERARAHLEAVAAVATDKALKKAARAAAYKLKSAGVDGEFRAGKRVDLAPVVDLDDIAVA